MLTYICSPYKAETEEQLRMHVEYAQEITRLALLEGDCPVTVHLYMTQCLNDDLPEERSIGLNAGKEVLRRCEKMKVGCRFGISKGMAAEIEQAKQQGIRIKYIDEEK